MLPRSAATRRKKRRRPRASGCKAQIAADATRADHSMIIDSIPWRGSSGRDRQARQAPYPGCLDYAGSYVGRAQAEYRTSGQCTNANGRPLEGLPSPVSKSITWARAARPARGLANSQVLDQIRLTRANEQHQTGLALSRTAMPIDDCRRPSTYAVWSRSPVAFNTVRTTRDLRPHSAARHGAPV